MAKISTPKAGPSPKFPVLVYYMNIEGMSVNVVSERLAAVKAMLPTGAFHLIVVPTRTRADEVTCVYDVS